MGLRGKLFPGKALPGQVAQVRRCHTGQNRRKSPAKPTGKTCAIKALSAWGKPGKTRSGRQSARVFHGNKEATFIAIALSGHISLILLAR